MKVFKSPQDTSNVKDSDFSIFLAGSIEMGVAEDWQTRLTTAMALGGIEIAIFNPRRDDWDSSWVQSIHDKQFNQQVTWEIDHLLKASLIVFYFDPNTKSPITLMELGLISGQFRDAVVCCPDGFWRKGNVEMICDRFNIPMVESLEELIQYVKQRA
jgi:hypothetical protein